MIPRSKIPQYEILQPRCSTTRISGYVIVTLRSLSSYFSNNSYLKYVTTGSKRDTQGCPSQRVQVRTTYMCQVSDTISPEPVNCCVSLSKMLLLRPVLATYCIDKRQLTD